MLADHRSCSTPYSFTAPPPNLEEEARLAEQAKAFIAAGKVTRLPYAGERTGLKFDRRNYRGFRRHRAFTDKLAWSDIQNGMHFISRASAYEMRLFYTPEFSKSDDLLRLVIAQEGYDYARRLIAGTIAFYQPHTREFYRVPEGFVRNREALESLCKRATDEMRKQIHGTTKGLIIQYRHISWCKAHGGYIALRTIVAYRAWREAKGCHIIADELGISKVGVRQILQRLCITATKLGLQTFPHHHSWRGAHA